MAHAWHTHGTHISRACETAAAIKARRCTGTSALTSGLRVVEGEEGVAEEAEEGEEDVWFVAASNSWGPRVLMHLHQTNWSEMRGVDHLFLPGGLVDFIPFDFGGHPALWGSTLLFSGAEGVAPKPSHGPGAELFGRLTDCRVIARPGFEPCREADQSAACLGEGCACVRREVCLREVG